MKDTIYRQDAIDAMCQGWCGLDNDKCKYPFDPKQYDDFFCEGCFAVEELKKLPSAQPEPHGVCMNCLMKNVCRFKTGLGDYGYCSQWRGEEHETN